MGNALQETSTVPPNGAPKIEGIEKALIGGDLSDLTEPQRLALYNARCQAAGLDPRTQPFAYILLKGKLTLYALKTASDQLIANRKLSVKISRRGFDRDFPGLYVVECQVTMPDGQSVEDIGATWISDRMFGDDLVNAILKAVTKAKRRTVLSACGLGMPDETEIETSADISVPLDHDRVIIERPPGPAIVHEPTNEPRSEVISEPRAWVRRTLQCVNDAVRNHFVIERKDDKFQPVANEHQIVQEMITQRIAAGKLDESTIKKPNGKRDPHKVGPAFQVAWAEDPEAMKAAIRAYLVSKTVALFLASGIEMPEELDLMGGDDESQSIGDED